MRSPSAPDQPPRRPVCFMVTDEGTARSFYPGYLSHLVARGWNVHLIASGQPGLDAFAAASGATVHHLPMQRDPAPLRDLVSLMRAIRLLHRLRPVAVVAATPKASLIGITAAWLNRVPTRVYQLWGLRLETSTGQFKKVLSVLENLTSTLATEVVANSHSLAAEYERLGLNGRREVVVLGSGSSHGVDTTRFAPPIDPSPIPEYAETDPSGHEPVVVGFIGRIHPDKGVSSLAEALRRCADRGTRIEALFVGGVEDTGLARRIDELSRHLSVVRHEEVSDVRPYLAKMDVLCLPSLREGFPNVVLEAAAMGKPAVVANTTGTKDAVVHQTTGLIVPPNDPEALAEAIGRLVRSPGLRNSLGTAARNRAVSEFDQEHIWRLQEDYLCAALSRQTERLALQKLRRSASR